MKSYHGVPVTLLLALTLTALAGCYDHKINTTETWCEQINGDDLAAKYQPFWARFFEISFHRDAIRDDFVKNLNDAYVEKVQRRTDRMVWREGMVLHIVNLSSFFVMEPGDFISEWRKGIAKAQTLKPMDRADTCMWDTVFDLFDSVQIHSLVTDPVSANWGDLVTGIPTDRRAILLKYHKYGIREDDADDWYLMVPPLVKSRSAYVACQHPLAPNTNSPIAQWSIEGSYHNDRECESEQKRSRELGAIAAEKNSRYLSSLTRKESPEGWSWSLPICENLARATQLLKATCVFSNDPRLAGS
jgi:hypothetical protein